MVDESHLQFGRQTVAAAEVYELVKQCPMLFLGVQSCLHGTVNTSEMWSIGHDLVPLHSRFPTFDPAS